MRVFKYPLDVVERQLIYMPKDAGYLSVQVQNGGPVLYVSTDDESNLSHRVIRCVTTGETFGGDDAWYIDTVLIDGWFVVHVFEEFDGGQDTLDSTEKYRGDWKQIKDKTNEE